MAKIVRYLIGLSNGWKVEHRRLRLWLSGVGCGALGAEHDEVLRGDQITGSEELGIDEQRCGSTRAERSGLLWSRRGFFSSGLTLMGRATFYMQTRWAKTHPVGKIDHPLQAFRPNWLIDCFLNFGKMILRKIIKIAATRLSYFKAELHQIRFRLRIRPRPRWCSLQRSPDPLAGFKGPTYTSVFTSHSVTQCSIYQAAQWKHTLHITLRCWSWKVITSISANNGFRIEAALEKTQDDFSADPVNMQPRNTLFPEHVGQLYRMNYGYF